MTDSKTIQAKGDELIERFEDDCKCAYSDSGYYTFSTKVMNEHAVKCAIIAVEEIITEFGLTPAYRQVEYWNEVLNYLKSKL